MLYKMHCHNILFTVCLLFHKICLLYAFESGSFMVSNRFKLSTSFAKPSSSMDSYETSDASSKGIVSSLTDLVNFVSGNKNDVGSIPEGEYAKSPEALMDFIEKDYTEKNYLWTGNIHLPAFDPACTFTDPTLSFQGTDTFVSNVKNLVPIVDFLTKTDDENREENTQSKLLNISINKEEKYVETRWNMIGNLDRIPWKPAIDVIGRTKFWYREYQEGDETIFRVHFYDEAWEIPAGRALLQLVTPKGTIPNSAE